MFYRQHVGNDLGFKGVDAIYWGPPSFRPHARDVTRTNDIANTDPSSKVLPLTEAQGRTSSDNGEVSFMSLPLEIRLMIYGYVHNMNHIKYTQLMSPSEVAQLSPWYPRMPLKRCVYQRVADKAEADEIRPGERRSEAALLTPHRIFAGFQSSLLRANKQVYRDCRDYPFLENEFVFFTWFSSGLWAAHSFMKRLQPWQRDSMRYVRLELMALDLQGACDQQWEDLCGWWSQGLRGLRLKILGVITATQRSNVVSEVIGMNKPTVQIRDDEGRLVRWIERGLRCMGNLEQIEVELVIQNWDDGMRLEWCRGLEEALNESSAGGKNPVRVTCVERVE